LCCTRALERHSAIDIEPLSIEALEALAGPNWRRSLARPPTTTTHPYWASEPPCWRTLLLESWLLAPCSSSTSLPAALVPTSHPAPSLLDYFVCPGGYYSTHHTTPRPSFLISKPSNPQTLTHQHQPTQTPPVDKPPSPPSPPASRGHRSAAMTKETLDSDRVNYLIWRYVFPRDPPTRFFRYEHRLFANGNCITGISWNQVRAR
jgi:hypothetical protein